MTLYNHSRKTIGVVIPIFWDGYYLKSIQGILDAAVKYNVNILVFQGLYCHEAYTDDASFSVDTTGSIIFDLIDRDILDGIIVQVGALRSHMLKQQLIDKCRKYHSIPIVNVGSEISGLTNVLVDNEIGMSDLLNHLINDHGFKKIGFLHGPKDSDDAQIRFNAFVDILGKNTICVEPQHISTPGIWASSWGKTETRSLLIKNGGSLDAIVCASDLLAVGAFEELHAQGISIPDQIAVVGFNDNTSALFSVPPLTTVNQNLYLRSGKAVSLLVDYFNGIPLPQYVKVPSLAVIRQSCGCPPICVMAHDALRKNMRYCSAAVSLQGNELKREQIIKKVQNIFNESLSYEQKEHITKFTDFFAEYFETDINIFLTSFSELLHESPSDIEMVTKWHWALNVVWEEFGCGSIEYGTQIMKESLLKARVLIGEVLEQKHKILLMKVEERNAKVNSFSYDLNKVNTLEAIIELLATDLPLIGIQTCYFSLYEQNDLPMNNARLVLAFNSSGRVLLPVDGIVFPAIKLVPDIIEIEDRSSFMIVEPLFYEKHNLGFILFDSGIIERSFYELFSSQLAAAIWGSILFRKEQEGEEVLKVQTIELEKTNNELKKWTSQIESAYGQLQNNQEKLLIAEKMASLGRFTEGITNEMDKPLAEMKESLSTIHQLALEYHQSVIDMKKNQKKHVELAEKMSTSIDIADSAAETVAVFIRSIKAQTRDVKSLEGQSFDLVDLIEGVIVFLGHSIRRRKCMVSIKSNQDQIELVGSANKMTQVFTNLVSNAIDAVDSDGDGKIDITLEMQREKNTIHAIVEDNGTGIEDAVLPKIFDPMFTTKAPGKGTGLGLSIVHDIICGEFGGEIKVESSYGAGTRVLMNFKCL